MSGHRYVSEATSLSHEIIEHLVDAASALKLPDRKGKATALLHTTIALVKIARLDADGTGREYAEDVIRRVVEESP